ncbi:sulfatase-like hydrolase/transferase [Prosthecobacter sp.]|uniref:sulfatase-like hydrolase/transferase n=1 Tax=Prosthecobacter sp. TaxID=1965333 RepID=UPI003784C028
MKPLLQSLVLLLLSLTLLQAGEQPNFIVINIDDLGYADIGPFGSKLNRTPNLDRMAAEGRKLTCFYAAPVCSPSRAALMTGCYPKRALPIGGVLFPVSATGLNPQEVTVAEILKDAGYATACIGKWHLGDQPEFLPTRQGFDYYLGIPYSNDMGPPEDGSKSSLGDKRREPKTGNAPKDDEVGIHDGARQPPLPLLENDKVIARMREDEQQGIVQRYTEAAVKFIQENKAKPFFLYLPHTAVHGPLYPGKAFAGRSPHGHYHDWVEEVDWAVGQVLDALRELKLEQKTFVLFTSDNGGTQHSDNTPLRGFKTTTWEGGMRVPTIAWWPGKIPAGTSCDEITGMFDVLPTLAKLAGGKLPADRKIDGADIWPLFAGTSGAESPHEAFYYYRGMKLEGVRSGPWKLRLASAADGAPKTKAGENQLYHLASDISESKNVAAAHPEEMKRLLALVDAAKDDLGLNEAGPGVRPLGRVENPQPILNKEDQVRDSFVNALGKKTGSPAKSAQQLNVLFIMADDLRAEIGCYGAKHIHSPNIDKLAASGTLFERAYCQVSVCNPSRSSLLGGVRPDTTGVLDNQHFLRPQLPDIVTLPQHFKNNGWQSVSLGKIFHHSEREPGDDPLSWSEPSWYHGVPDPGWFVKETQDKLKAIKKLPPDKRPKLVRGPPFEAADEPDEVYGDAMTAAKAIETLQRLKEEKKPFFLGVGFHKPHLPFNCPQKYWDMYPADTIKLPDNYKVNADVPAQALHNWYELRSYGTVPPAGGIPDEMALNLIRGYRACTTFVDAQIGRVLGELDRLGLRENTVVVLLGDHGYHLGENNVFTKMTNFELCTRAPLIVSAPGHKPGQRTKALVEFVDIYPTLSELCGLGQPSHLEGTSFVPLLADPAQKGKRAAFSQYLRPGKEKFMGRSVRTDRWRYTEWTNEKDEIVGTELYDERTDPQENHNLVKDPANAKTLEAMAKQLHEGAKRKASAVKKAEAPKSTSAALEPNGDLKIGSLDGSGIQARGDDAPKSTGTLQSPAFKLERSYINYLVAGARDLPSRLGVELIIDGKVVRAAGATEIKDPTKSMLWRTWDVSDLKGKTAQIRVNDQSIQGSIAVDSFAQSDTAKGLPVDASILGYESLRPQYHYTTLTGWLNDANGLVYDQGVWHLFHQHRPPDRSGITWGHAKSNDLLHWQRLPEAIQIDDGNGVAASGSGMVDWKDHSGLQRGEHPPLLFFYSEHSHAPAEDRINQCLAFSNDAGKTFEFYEGNPLLVTPATKDRDPKVFYHGPSQAWIMALSLSRDNKDREHATYGIFRSPDLKSWKLIQELGPGSWFWECPDMYPLNVDGDPARTKWIFQKGSGDYIVGTFDGHKFTAETDPIRTNWGGNFYGAQSFNDAPNGRRVHLGWMSTGKDGPKSWPGMPFNQQMSFPRELTLRTTPEGPRLFSEPVDEISQLYKKTREVKPRPLSPGENALEGISGDLLDIELEVELQSAQQITFNLRGDPIFYDVKEQRLRITGRDREFAMLSLKPQNGKLILRILLDITSIELFGNHGEVNHARDFFPNPSNHTLSLTVKGGPAQVSKLIVHELKSIWPAAPSNNP